MVDAQVAQDANLYEACMAGKSASLRAVYPMDASPGGCCGDGTKYRGGRYQGWHKSRGG